MNTGIVYTRGTQILASLGRGAPIGAAHAKGPAVRDPKYATTAAAMLYPRPGGDVRARPKSPVVGKDSPRQYEAAGTPGVRPRNRDGSEAPPAPDMPTGPKAQYSPPPLFQKPRRRRRSAPAARGPGRARPPERKGLAALGALIIEQRARLRPGSLFDGRR